MIGSDSPRVTIVVPMYNEVTGLPQLVAQLDEALEVVTARLGLPRSRIELIAVDDGSNDGTAEALAKIRMDPPLRTITHERNRGLGAAIWTGIDAARGDVILTLDSDCTYPPREIVELLVRLDESTDIVTASPYHPDGGVDGIPSARLLLSRSLSILYSLAAGRRLYTFTAMFRAYRREILAQTPRRSDDFLGVAELLIIPVLRGARVREYPTVLHVRRFGQSKMRILRVIGSHLTFIGRLLLHRLGVRRLRLAAPERGPRPVS